jgi:hypothetical protein
MNYVVSSVTKGTIDQSGVSGTEPYMYGLKQWMHKTYKYHTVKQRRTYQVGIVFSDIYGRQSPVILSSNISTSQYNPDTYTMPEVTNSFGAYANAVWDNTVGSYGKSLTIEFQDNYITSDPKFIANMIAQSKGYNPHGWYSYRIVVKQQEQEYYNVYAPHTFDGWDNIKGEPNDSLSVGRSWLFLHGDNVNKIPRSLNDTDLNRDGTMGSNVRLYPKVIFDTDGESRMNNSYHELTEVVSLGTAYEQNLFISGDDNLSGTGGFSVLDFVYGKDKNPLVAELQNMKIYNGSTSNNEAKIYYAHDSSTNSTTVKLNLDQLGNAGTHANFSNGDLNDWVVSKSSPARQEEITVETTTAASGGAEPYVTLSSEQSADTGDKFVFSNYYEGLSVFETEPFKSKLDIYYETSTSGLVADLVQEMVSNPDDYPTGLTIKQTYDPELDNGEKIDYDFGDGQPGVGYSDAGYGEIAYLYENLDIDSTDPSAPISIGDLDATQAVNSGATKDLTFSLKRVIKVGDSSDATSSFQVGTKTINGELIPVLKINSYFTYRGSSFDEYIVTVSVTDNTQSPETTSDLQVYVNVVNSKPTIQSLSSEYEIYKNVGENSIVIDSNSITNGGTSTGGVYNKYYNISVTHDFGDSTLNNLFYIYRPSIDYYELRTTNDFTVPNAEEFFTKSQSDRTVTITAKDSSGLTATASTEITENELTVFFGKLWDLSSSTLNAVKSALRNNGAFYHATIGSSGGAPTGGDSSDDTWVLVNGNKVYTKADLSAFAPAGSYALVEYRTNPTLLDILLRGAQKITAARVVSIDSSGIVSFVTRYEIPTDDI